MEKMIRVKSLSNKRFFNLKCLLTMLFCIAQLSLFSQSLKVAGTVTDNSGATLPGVNIIVKNTSIGSVTDLNGTYSIDVPNDAILVFSSIGYQNQEVTLAGQTVLDIVMQEAFYDFDEVVVTALGIKREQKSLGYSVTEIKSDEITESGNSNPIAALSGKIAGVNITQTSAGPSGSSRVVIRGYTEIAGDNQPLYVIDGIPAINKTLGQAGQYGGYDMGDGLSDINPDDIESVSVLKGAGASALYGSRAQNGVILITTKTGKAQKGIGVEVSSSLTFDVVDTHFDTYQTKYGMGSNDSLPVNSSTAYINTAWGQRLNSNINITHVDGVERPYKLQEDRIKDFFDVGVTNTNNIAFTGGNENTSMRLSISNTSNSDIIPQSGLDRYSVNLRTFSNFGKRLKVDAKIGYSREDIDNRPGLGDSYYNVGKTLSSWAPNVDPSMLENYYKDENGEYVSWTNSSYSPNPYWIINNTSNYSEKNRYIGMLSFDLEIIKNLTLNVKGGLDRYDFKFVDFHDIYTPNNETGMLNNRNVFKQETNLSALLTYTGDINEDINFSVSAGANLMNGDHDAIYVQGVGANVSGDMSINNFSNVTTTPYASKKEIQSVYGFGQVSYKNFIYLDITARNDWSSAFFSEVNTERQDFSYFYPSASLSFLVNEAIELPSLISFAKARISWSQIGSDTDPFLTQRRYSFSSRAVGNTPFASVSGNIAPLLNAKPQSTTSIETGIDVRFFSNRLGLDVAYYNDVTNDMLVTIPVDPTSGFANRLANTGEIKNQGLEILLNTVPVKTKDLRWDLTFNFAKNWNEVVKLNDEVEQITIADARWGGVFVNAAEGKEYGELWGLGYSLDENGNRLMQNGYAQSESKKLGNILPDWTGGIRSNLNYKGINLGMAFDIRMGGDIYSMTNSGMVGSGTSDITLEGRDEREYIAEGIDIDTGDPNAVIVKPSHYWSNLSTSVAEEFIYDASFVKLRELTLSYNIPDKFIQKAKLQGLTIGFVGRNLWTLYKNVPNIDPETTYNNGNGQGLEYGSIPTRKNYGFKISFKL